MTEQIGSAIVALLGTGVGALLTYLVGEAQHHREQRALKRKLLLDKLEEAHGVLRSIKHQYTCFYGEMVSRIELGEPAERSDNGRIESDRLLMLVSFYIPQLLPEIESLETAREQMGEVFCEIILNRDRSEQAKAKLRQNLQNANTQVTNAIQAALTSTSRIASTCFGSHTLISGLK